MIFLLECGGKMHLREGEFEKAHTDFFEAFKNYDESGELLNDFRMELSYKSNILLQDHLVEQHVLNTLYLLICL